MLDAAVFGLAIGFAVMLFGYVFGVVVNLVVTSTR